MKRIIMCLTALLAASVMLCSASCSNDSSKTDESKNVTAEEKTSVKEETEAEVETEALDDTMEVSLEENGEGENDASETEVTPESEEADISALSEDAETPSTSEAPSVSDAPTAVESDEVSAEAENVPEASDAKESVNAYNTLCDYIQENGTDVEGFRRVTGSVNGMPVILQLDGNGQLVWYCAFEEELTTSMLSVYVGETNETNKVSMTVIDNVSGEVSVWNAVLNTSTFVIGDFGAVELVPEKGTTLTDAEKTDFVINTQIAVLGADEVFKQLGLGIRASDFGFDIGE